MSVKYSLTVSNGYVNFENICVYQPMPNQPDVPLAIQWFIKGAPPGIDGSGYTA